MKPAAAIIPNQGIPVTVTTPTATTAGNIMPHTIPVDVDEAVPAARTKPGGISAVDKQLQRLQIDMTDMPKRSTVQNTVATRIRENNKELYTDGTTDCVFNVSVNSNPGDPNSTAEAMKSSEWKHWQAGMFDEYDNFTKRMAWNAVARPTGRKVLCTKNVYKRKVFAITKELRYKVRNCVLGYEQIPGVDYTESYAAVVADQTIRTALGISLFYKLFGHDARRSDTDSQGL